MKFDYDKTYYNDDVLLKDTIPASTTYSSPSPYLERRVEVTEHHFRFTCN